MSEIIPENKNFNAKSSPAGKFIVYLSFLLIIPIFLFIISRNNFMRLQQAIEETASDINVQLKRRFDLLTKLVDATKGYMKFEKDTLTKVTELRTNMVSVKDFANAENGLNAAYGKFNAVLENYPDLKASATVLNLQASARDCEDNIAAARRFYNANVKTFNSKLLTFPSNVIAENLRLESKEFFLTNSEERKDVKVDFS